MLTNYKYKPHIAVAPDPSVEKILADRLKEAGFTPIMIASADYLEKRGRWGAPHDQHESERWVRSYDGLVQFVSGTWTVKVRVPGSWDYLTRATESADHLIDTLDELFAPPEPMAPPYR